MKRIEHSLLIALPLASVLALTVLLLLAIRTPDDEIRTPVPPLSKTSWRSAT